MELSELISYLQSIAPEDSAMQGDPVGLSIEPAASKIASVAVCLDATDNVIAHAIRQGAQLIIAHHPLIYHPLRRLERAAPVAAAAMECVRHGIGLYAMHTNWDLAPGGINDTLASLIALTDIRPLPNQPIARIGRASLPSGRTDAPGLIEHVVSALACSGMSALRHTPLARFARQIETVAVCGGQGEALIPDAIAAGADAFVTADVRHDRFIDAAQRGLFLIDAGHEATEAPGMRALAEQLGGLFPELDIRFYANWK